jgi:hypothetical protein
VFTIGIGGVGVISLISGFLRNKIALIVMRAFTGICEYIDLSYLVEQRNLINLQ